VSGHDKSDRLKSQHPQWHKCPLADTYGREKGLVKSPEETMIRTQVFHKMIVISDNPGSQGRVELIDSDGTLQLTVQKDPKLDMRKL
jgi:hypothetical protein